MNAEVVQATDFDLAVNMARQSLYRFAALSLLDPRAGAWVALSSLRDDRSLAEAATLIRGLPEAAPAEFASGERPLVHLDPRPALELLPDDATLLNAEYEATFGLLASTACPPYETEYIDSKFTFQRSNELADVSGFYRAFGLDISSQRRERHDHIVLELEFMAFLLGLERSAAADDSERREQRLEVCRDAQSRFLKEHLAWWVPAFAKLLAREDCGGFYEAVGIFLSALIPAERALLKVDCQSRRASPSPQERPEECDGCQLAT